MLYNIIESNGTKISWKFIADKLGTGRSEYDCYFRWNKQLQPAMRRHAQQLEQNELQKKAQCLDVTQTLTKGMSGMGLAIESLKNLQKHSPKGDKSRKSPKAKPKNNQDKHRIPAVSKGQWTKEEDEIIKAFVKKNSPKDSTGKPFSAWTALAQHLTDQG